MISFNVILFDDFETLDAFGPAEIIGKMPKAYKLEYFSMNGGAILSSQQVSVNTFPFSEIDTSGVVLIPGGMGTRKLVDDIDFINQTPLYNFSKKFEFSIKFAVNFVLWLKIRLDLSSKYTKDIINNLEF